MKLHIVVGASLVLASGSALAQQAPSPQFTREYQAGVDAYRLGQYAEARTHLDKAKAFEPKLPGPYRFLAAVDQAEQKFADCVEHARTAIKLNPTSSEIGDTRKLHDACRASLGRPAMVVDPTSGAISVTSSESGASVTLNDLKYGATPLAPRAVAVGEAEIGVSKDGWLPQKKKIDVLPGVVTDVDFTMELDPKAKPLTDLGDVKPSVPTTGFLEVKAAAGATVTFDGKPAALDKDGKLEAGPGEHEIELRAPGYEPWRRRVRIARGQKITVLADMTASATRSSSHTLGLTFVSIGTVLAIGGAGAGIYSYRQAQTARDWARIEETRPDPSLVPLSESSKVLPLHTRADIEAQNDKAKSWGLVSDAGLAAAAIGIGVGVYFLVKDRPEERDGAPPPFAIAPIVGRGDSGFVVEKAVRW